MRRQNCGRPGNYQHSRHFCGSIRCSTAIVYPSCFTLLRHWSYPMVEDKSLYGTSDTLRMDFTTKPGLLSAFATPSVAEQWALLANKLESVARDRNIEPRVRDEMISACQVSLAALLGDARCAAVHRVLDSMVHPQPCLTEARCVIYALCSPLLSKCYVGAVGFKGPRAPLKRWREHMSLANLWNSKTSRHRYLSRRPELYTALAQAGLGNVVMIILAVPSSSLLGFVERKFIRQLSPVYNWMHTADAERIPGISANVLGSATCDDLFSLASRVLRQAHPKLSKKAWASLIRGVLLAGDRLLAAKLARVARSKCPPLHSLRASCRVTIHCPVPARLLLNMQRRLRHFLFSIPAERRTTQFIISSRCVVCKWGKSPLVESVIAPSSPDFQHIGQCSCLSLKGTRIAGHIVTRNWWELPVCSKLYELCANCSLSQRTYRGLAVLCADLKLQAKKLFRSSGMEKEDTEATANQYSEYAKDLLSPWMGSLPQMLIQRNIRKALRIVHNAGFLFVRIDRSPGRVMAICREAWQHLQQVAFLHSPRCSPLSSAEDDKEYAD